MCSILLLLPLLVACQDDSQQRAEDLHEQGLKLFEHGDADAGLKAVRESLRIHTRLGLKESQAVNLRLLALIHDGIGERQKSIEYYKQALTLARAIPKPQLEANTLRDMGVLHYNLDDNTTAFRYLEQSLLLQRKIGQPKGLAQTLFGLGEMRRAWGESAKARANFDEALRLAREAKDRKNEADILSSLAALDLRGGRAFIDQALQIRLEMKDVRGEASTRLKLGSHFQSLGDASAALEQYRTAAALFARMNYRGGEAFAHQLTAIVEREQGRPRVAVEEMFRAVELAESLRRRLSDRDLRATYIGYVQNRYEFLIEVLLEQGDVKRAFEVSERARARAMVETLSDAGASASSKPTLTLEAIQAKVLDEDTALYEYALGTKRSHLFVVTKRGITHYDLPARSVLEAKLGYAAYRQAGPLPDSAAIARMVAPGGMAHPRVLVVAEGALQYVPFAALTPAVVVYAPSASSLAAMRANVADRKPKLKLAVFADPDAPQYARLPFARAEADSILGLLPESAGSRLRAVGAEATGESVRRNPAEILHFAAHAIVDTERPERTEIVLAGGGGLRLRDLHSMRVDASLVVLSACQTALGKEMKREGLASLAHAFQQARAERVVASLWKVDDRATAELMKHFYTAMFQTSRPASVALREAQDKLARSKRWSHPYYWAGFVLQGEWR